MATTIIDHTILKNIAAAQTVFANDENKVYQWKKDLTEWNAAAQPEGSTITVGDAYKAISPDGNSIEVVKVDSGLEFSISTDLAAIAANNDNLITNLSKLDETTSNSGVLSFGGSVWGRNFAGSLGGTTYKHSSPGVYVSDTENVVSTNTDAGGGSTKDFVILKNGHTVVINSYYGTLATSTETVPANSIFRVDSVTASDFNDYGDAGATDVKVGFYKTAGSSVTLVADSFKADLGTAITIVDATGADYSTAQDKAHHVVCDEASELHVNAISMSLALESNVEISSGPTGTLAAPESSNIFWTERPGVANPIDNNGYIQGTAFSIDSAGKELAQGEYFDIISSGLATDISNDEARFWSETQVLESSDALQYRE